MPMARSADEMIATASPSAAPCARLKLKVTEGNCSWCAIDSGAVVRIISANADSGTCVLLAPGVKADSGWMFCALEDCSGWLGMFAGMEILDSAEGARWYCGAASRITRYWFA